MTVGANVVAYNETGLIAQHHVLLSRAGHQRRGRLGQHAHATHVVQRPTLAGPSASLVTIDTTTQGNWVGSAYGADGYNVIGDSSSYPSYATVSASGHSVWTWASSTSDVRALQKASNHSDRIAGVMYSSTSFDLTINITGGTRQVAIYCLDWDSLSRSESIAAYDAGSGAQLMSPQTISSMTNGKYVVLNLNGNVRLHFTNLAGSNVNAVISGIFFGTSAPAVPNAPSGLTASTASSSQINLGWHDNSNNETGFKIDQSTTSDFSSGVTTTTVGANVVAYSETGLASSTAYYYRVRATNALGDSANTPTPPTVVIAPRR